eukprot:jgi/Mesvir1/17668/Mv01368-RA.1
MGWLLSSRTFALWSLRPWHKLSANVREQRSRRASRGALAKSGVDPSSVAEVLMGNVLTAGVGQAPARQAALGAGLPASTSCTTVNKMCASGMKAIMFATQALASGTAAGPIVAGGMESMSNAPYLLPKARSGYRLGHGTLVDSLIHDGLWDAFHGCHMGDAAELCAEEMGIGRAEMDDTAVQSYERALQAQKDSSFQEEIVPVRVPSAKRGEPDALVRVDEEPKKFDEPKLRALRPAFKKDRGTVTPGNASVISDGAAALVLCQQQQAEAMGLRPVAQILGMADAEQEPLKFTTTPALAVPRALAMAGLKMKDIDYFEINEAFAVVSIANQRLLGLTPDRVNVHGGAVALGHPIGASGARIVISLINVLRARQARHGVAAICNGGGGASALVVKLL